MTSYRGVVLIAAITFGMTGCDRRAAGVSAEDPLHLLRGRYARSASEMVVVDTMDGQLTVRPFLWRGGPRFRASGIDTFVTGRDGTQRVIFARDGRNQPVAIRLENIGLDGTYARLRADETMPIEILLAGYGEQAVDAMLRHGKSAEELVEIAKTLLEKWPSKRAATASFLSALSHRITDNPTVYALLGQALVASGDRQSAAQAFQKAQAVDPGDDVLARIGLGRLEGHGTPDNADGWTVPFPLSQLFEPPSEAEIENVRTEWAMRDLAPRDVREVARHETIFAGSEFVISVISHRVHDDLHYGAVIVPADPAADCCAVVVTARGVSWNYRPLRIGNGLRSSDILDTRSGDVIYIVPSFRGETIIVDDQPFTSEGDPTNSWDGATDDTIALLSVVLAREPLADSTRVCVVGGSRGGSVALLAGIRDRRVRCVVSIAAPTDWFTNMAYSGWTQEEFIGYALRQKAQANEDGGQFIRRFLSGVIEGKHSLAQARTRMIASSPLYFVSELPPTSAHYGLEDEMVPVANGKELARLASGTSNSSIVTVTIHRDEGHDVNVATVRARQFLQAHLFRKNSSAFPG